MSNGKPTTLIAKELQKSCKRAFRFLEGDEEVPTVLQKSYKLFNGSESVLGDAAVPAALLALVFAAMPVSAEDSSNFNNFEYGLNVSGSVDEQPFGLNREASSDTKYSFDSEEYRSVRYSTDLRRLSHTEHRTEFQFSLRPGKFDFSFAGGFGLGAVFSNPEFELRSSRLDRYTIDSSLPRLYEGLSYSAGFNIEHENAHISDTAYVSSGQLGLNYGRMGRVWYSGLDLSFEQSAATSNASIKNEVMSFDLTTGRRLGITGIGSDDPLWLLSLRGDFDFRNDEGAYLDEASVDGDWYLNPTLFWDRPGFRFAAQLELPIDEDTLRDFEPPDYKLRAVIEKSFK